MSYCSCDIHFGDAAQDYDNTDPAHPLHVEHRGYQNSKVVEKWAREHFVNPEEVFVSGSSAGAYGAITGAASSLNAAVAATVVLYEAARQRNG